MEQFNKVSMRKIPISQGKYALVDDKDFEWLNQWKWFVCKNGQMMYVHRNERNESIKEKRKQITVSMHRSIMKTPKGMDTDHINGDGLDNRRSNLRICTHAENTKNKRKTYGTSRYKGVHWCKHNKRWYSYITHNKKQTFVGSFNNERSGAIAYNKAAKKYHGIFAKLNKICPIVMTQRGVS